MTVTIDLINSILKSQLNAIFVETIDTSDVILY
jgi:hypothetical protein